MIRLSSITLQNFKNTAYGKVILSEWQPGNPFPRADIVGLYGQNGSGKTSVIQALSILKNIFNGRSVEKVAAECIMTNKNRATITLDGWVLQSNDFDVRGFFSYVVELSEEKQNPTIASEKFSYKDYGNQRRRSNRTLFNYKVDSESPLGFSVSPKTSWNSLFSICGALRTEVAVAQRMAAANHGSFLFRDDFYEILTEMDNTVRSHRERRKGVLDAYERTLCPLLSAIREISLFSLSRFVVVSTRKQAESMANKLHIATHEGRRGALADTSLDVDLSKPAILDQEEFGVFQRTLDGLNPVLSSLVPGLRLDVVLLDKLISDNGAPAIKIEVMSSRGGMEVPLRCESEGIKKLVSILILLIDVYGRPGACVAIDELDSGIFEFLLGEILQVLQDHGRGQLIFTAHNLRPLEIVDQTSLVFTTTNPKNRYVRFKGNRDTCNLRSQYLRAVNLGGQPEKVYEPTSKFDIDGAFYDAVFSNDGDADGAR